jgi:putative redox protein
MQITVDHLTGDRFEVAIRGHRLLVDQPVAGGGEDAGPTPTELFVAGLAACVGFYAGRWLRRHDLDADDLWVRCEAVMSADRPARVAAIALHVAGLPELPARRREALLAVVRHCTVHNSIRQAPVITVELEDAGRDATAHAV